MSKKRPASPKPAFPFATPPLKGPFAHPVVPFDAGGGTCDLVKDYLNERLYRNDKDAEQIATCLAIGRAALLLQEARTELEGYFDIIDIEQLLLAFGPGFYMPGEDAALHASLAAAYSWESLEDVPVSMRSLFRKLCGLTSAQCLALADVLERISNVYLPSGKHNSIASAAAAAGLLLNDAPFED